MSIYQTDCKEKLLRKVKEIHVPIHGSVSITHMAKCFIDNKYFQRLRELKQLGTCDLIFPGATHTRFEHSIGTYYLADRILIRIKNSSDNLKMKLWLSKIPELKIHFEEINDDNGLNSWIIELIKIAALCHDIGHGPYSHIFDDIFIKNSKNHDHPMATHEARSCSIVEKIVKNDIILSKYISEQDIKFIQSVIDPTTDNKGFVYQIVSNNINGLDVDKYDYICRDTFHIGSKNGFDHHRLIDSVLVIDNKIVYPEQVEQDIYNLFMIRHSLHRKVYVHKGVVSSQFVIINIMNIIDKVIDISDSINDLDKFLKMTDKYIIQYMNFILDFKDNPLNPFLDKLSEKDYHELDVLKQRLQTHTMYTHIGTALTKEPIDVKNDFNDNQHIIFRSKVGYVSGNKLNPLDMIYVYKTKDHFIHGYDVKAHLINKNEISHIISDVYQEHIIMIFRKDQDFNAIQLDKEIFQKIKDLNIL